MNTSNATKQSVSHLPDSLKIAFGACLCCLLWGSAFPSIKIGYRLYHIGSTESARQILFAGCRFLLSGILVIVFGTLLRMISKNPLKEERTGSLYPLHGYALIPQNRITILHALILCLFQTVLQYFFFYMGLAHTSGVKSSVITGSNVFFSILVSCLIFRQEKLTLSKITGCLIGFLGILIMNLSGGQFDTSLSLNGEGFIVISAISSAFSASLIKRYTAKNDAVLLSGWQFIFGGVILILLGFLNGGRITCRNFPSAAILLYMAFISAFAYTLWGILIKQYSVSRVTIFGFTNPIFGVLLSALLIGEASQAFQLKNLLALTFVSIGIYIVNANFTQKFKKNGE